MPAADAVVFVVDGGCCTQTGAVDRQMDSQDETGAVSATQHGCVAGTHRHRKGFFARMFG